MAGQIRTRLDPGEKNCHSLENEHLESSKHQTCWHQRKSVPELSLEDVTRIIGSEALIGECCYRIVDHATLNNGKDVAVVMVDSFAHLNLKVTLNTGINVAAILADSFADLNLKSLTQVGISRLKHDNLVELEGYFVQGSVRVLAYEFAPMGSLYDILHGTKGVQGVLNWRQRVSIALDVARVVEYLHENVQPSVIHGYIRSRNVLIFEGFKAKLADFSLSNQSTDADDTVYFAPEYYLNRKLTKKTDVFSFGVVLGELLTGRKPFDPTPTVRPSKYTILSWVGLLLLFLSVKKFLFLLSCIDRDPGRRRDIYVDPKLKGEYPREEVALLANVAAACLQSEGGRPNMMRQVVKLVEKLKNAPALSQKA
ncbi:hypothetical protein PTKIN_Ptkin10aG0196900 [Pterospermum kingtungense]